MEQTIIQLNSISISSQASCGYCGGRKCQQKLWATSSFYCNRMSIRHYQMLMDRGWRRSGVFYYRPSLSNSCCQAFTIRLNVDKYYEREMHKKVIKRIRGIRVLKPIEAPVQQHDDAYANIAQIEGGPEIDVGRLQILEKTGSNHCFKNIQLEEQRFRSEFRAVLKEHMHKLDLRGLANSIAMEFEFVELTIQSVLQEFQVYECTIFKGQINGYSGKWTFGSNLVALLCNRLQVKDLKYLAESFDQLPIECYLKKNDQQLYLTTPESLKHKQYKSKVLYWLQIRNNSVVPQIQEQPKEIKIKWTRAQFEPDSFELYCRYQKQVHHKESVSKQSYLSFLCQDALPDDELGCWHMKYYLEDHLLAVGVVDLLAESLSSVYFYYDPDYKKYSLGVYGVLQEIDFVRHRKLTHPEFKYYYMGYYIQDSQKMAYKGDYQRCELLCTKTYNWVELNLETKERIKQINENALDVEQTGVQFDCSIDAGQEILNDMDFKEMDIDQYNQQVVKIMLGQKIYAISQLKRNYAGYFANLFESLLPRIGKQLMNEFLFQTK